MDSSSTSEDEPVSSISSGKKVRFDLNDEVFEIPNKWDRLSTRVAARRNKLVEEVSKNGKGKVLDSDRRGKNKQNKSKKVRKTSKKTDGNKSRETSRTLVSSSNQVLSLDSSVLSTQIKPQKGGGFDKNSSIQSKTKKVTQNCIPEVKLKLSHRGSVDVSSSDIVLPKISYSSDLKKAIENAVVRNRVSPQEFLGGSLSSARERYRISPQEIFPDYPSYASGHRRTSENVILTATKQRAFSHPPRRSSSTEELNFATRKGERLLALPEYEPKFSELTRDVEGWGPFAGGENKDPQQRKAKNSSIQPAWIIPNSILY